MKTVETVTIRMYRQGLGDCFLLIFKDKDGKKFNILIDCGVLSKAAEFKATMNEVAENIKEVTNNKINILVATHEHWDHLSGFIQAKSVFDSMDITEIWMAWTEDPKDVFAKTLKDSHSNKLKAITSAFNRLKNQSTKSFNLKQKEGHTKYLDAYKTFFDFYGIDNNVEILSLNGTGEAFDVLKNRTKSNKLYLTPNSNEVIELKELPGIRIYVLGPPKNAAALNKMNPSKKSSEVYEFDYEISLGNSFSSAFNSELDINKPFNDIECISATDAKKIYPDYFGTDDWRTIEDDWLYSAGNLAIALDNAVNNTSLVLAFEFIASGKVLLFPADAQIGNWLSWSNYEWNIINKDGSKEKVVIDDLLSRTVFYKVGHHGSHNATIKDQGLEKMSSNELIAMIPVNKDMAKARNWKMPFQPLLEALKAKTKDKVIIQDEDYPDTIKEENKVKDAVSKLYFDVVISNK